MSNMFDNYTITSEQPCNLNRKHVNKSCRKPYEEYNAEGKLVGYYWYYGDAINLQFEITGEVSVDNDAIVYTALGDYPTTSTIGTIGQKAYNITESKSWTCSEIIESNDQIEYIYIWLEDSEFKYPDNGGKAIYISASQYLTGKKARIEIFDFRYNKILEQVIDASSINNFNIDLETSAKLLKGIYYCQVSLLSDKSVTYLNNVNEDAITFNVR